MSYVKLHAELFESSIWQEDSDTKIVWITLLLLANRYGEVAASVPGLAARSGIPLAQTERIIESLLAPDPYSRTKDDEGRRITPIQGGWQVLNYDFYRRKRDKEDIKKQNAERQRRWRERQKRNAKCHDITRYVTENNDIAEAEVQADDNSNIKKVRTSPKTTNKVGDVEGFDEWWKLVPFKVGKGNARKAFAKARKIASIETLTNALPAYRAQQEKRMGGDPGATPLQPATWLNQERWTDEDTTTAAPERKVGSSL